jgi:hypothetical protein
VREPIQGGYTDDTDRGVVGVALATDSGDIYRTCSGSLIAPNLVLTAQHCVASTSQFVRCDDSAFGDPVTIDHLVVTTDPTLWGDDTLWRRASELAVPPGAPSVCGRDLALIVLKDSVSIPPMSPRLDGHIEPEENYSTMGYGGTSDDGDDGGLRRRRDGLSIQCVGQGCDSDRLVGDEWRGDHGICRGDSGGPAVDAQGLIIGVTSRGPLGCDNPIYSGLGLLGPWITDVGAHAAKVGAYSAPSWSGGGNVPREQELSCTFSTRTEFGPAPLVLALAAVLFRRRRSSRQM